MCDFFFNNNLMDDGSKKKKILAYILNYDNIVCNDANVSYRINVNYISCLMC